MAQQSPEQQEWQLPALQQLPPQQSLAFGQQAAPTAARAEKESSDAASRVNSFVFMIGFLSV
ncbi:MAG: hypothetical protein WA294_22245 [Acidobacteriaceae bacterium]